MEKLSGEAEEGARAAGACLAFVLYFLLYSWSVRVKEALVPPKSSVPLPALWLHLPRIKLLSPRPLPQALGGLEIC